MRLTSATVSVIGVTALDVYAARAASTREPRSAPGALRRDGSVRVEHTMVVNRPASECYAMWRDFENLPRFMEHLESVERREGNRSHWVAKGPAGMSVEWDAEITDDETDELIAWRSLEGSRGAERRRGALLAGARRARHRGRASRCSTTRRRASSARRREALRRGAGPADPRRPAPLQAALETGEIADDRRASRRGSPAPLVQDLRKENDR